MNTEKYLKVKNLIKEADAILIGAGAGLSSSAGIDYSKKMFEEKFPYFVKNYGMTDMYTSSFYEFDSEEERWNYWAKHINYSYIEPKPLYKDLLKLVQNKNYFVITTNVDGQFIKSGFDKTKVFEVQGSYGKIQCEKGCHKKVYDDVKLVKEMLKSSDNLKIPSKLVPHCPVCNGNMDVNIRKNMYFVEDDNWNKLNNAYEKFISDNINKKLVLLEFGVGFNTPSIIRFPFERLASYDNITLIRVNEMDFISYYEESNIIYVKDDCFNMIRNVLK